MTTVNLGRDLARNAHHQNEAREMLVGSLFEVIPTGRALGAEIWNVDVRSFDDWAFAALMRALLKHQVLLVRGQTLGANDLVRFRRRLGQAVVWLAPPTTLGETSSFISLHAVYDALPPALRRRIAHLKIRHPVCDDACHLQPAGRGTSDGTVQPLVGVHPDTGRAMLHLADRSQASLVGMQPDDSDALLDELWQFAAAAEFAWDYSVRPGDLVISDPRCTLYRRAMAEAVRPRLLHRAEIWSSMSPA
ncbi:MAG: TauD/TfdA family dioxygenase [Tardiphaga sp.]